MIEKGKDGGRVEVEVRIDAPADEVWRALSEPEQIRRWFPLDARGECVDGGTVELTWGGDEWWATRVEIPEPGRHLRFVSDMPGPSGETLTLFVDYTIESEGGASVVRLVHSGFGPGDDWDQYLEGLDAGWGYFLRNLKVYLEKHPGVERVMAWARPAVSGSRAAIWSALLGIYGVEPASVEEMAPGAACSVDLGGPRVSAVLEAVAPGRTLAVRFPEHGETLLFLEIESAGEKGRVGIWLSLYDTDEEIAAVLRRGVVFGEQRLQAELTVPSS